MVVPKAILDRMARCRTREDGRKAGIDITRERVLVYPVLHYLNGGLAIDVGAREVRSNDGKAGDPVYA